MLSSHVGTATGPHHRTRRTAPAVQCRRKFLRFFPKGFHDPNYLTWERDDKAEAHQQWSDLLNPTAYASLLRQHHFEDIASQAIRIESRTNLLFSFEKMALRNAVRSPAGARLFAEGLYDFLYGRGPIAVKFTRWCEVVARLRRKQTRVLTWPVVTVFGFLALPATHILLKPKATRLAAERYGFAFAYESTPAWETYRSLLEFAATLTRDLRHLRPRDMIDIQSFMWVQSSDEYDE
jgi:hypothetical protein